MRNNNFVSALFIICVLFGAAADIYAMHDSEGWSSIRRDLYINRKSAVRLPGDRVSLWVKTVPESGSDVLSNIREEFIAKGREDQALAYQYTAFLSEIDCLHGRHRELVTILYDANKNIMGSAEDKSGRWSDILPGSPFRSVEKAVCDDKQAGLSAGQDRAAE